MAWCCHEILILQNDSWCHQASALSLTPHDHSAPEEPPWNANAATWVPRVLAPEKHFVLQDWLQRQGRDKEQVQAIIYGFKKAVGADDLTQLSFTDFARHYQWLVKTLKVGHQPTLPCSIKARSSRSQGQERRKFKSRRTQMAAHVLQRLV